MECGWVSCPPTLHLTCVRCRRGASVPSKLVSPAVAGPGLTLESLPVRRRSPMTARIRHDRRSATAAASQSDETRPAPAESRIVSSALNGLAAEAGAPNAGEQTGNHVPGRSGIRPLVHEWGERRNHCLPVGSGLPAPAHRILSPGSSLATFTAPLSLATSLG